MQTALFISGRFADDPSPVFIQFRRACGFTSWYLHHKPLSRYDSKMKVVRCKEWLMIHRRLGWCAMVVLLFVHDVGAEVKLPAVFSDHAVLQRDIKIPIWGWASPGEEIQISLGDHKGSTKANDQGEWKVNVGPLKAGGPLTLTVAGKNRVTVKNILVGEVWLCSGQSNMAMTVQRSNNFKEESARARFPKIRMFTVARNPTSTPQKDCTGSWVVCSPDTVGRFSATAYFFGLHLHQQLDVPVGLINSSYGGTAIEAWTSMDAQKGKAPLKPILAQWQERAARYHPNKAKAAYEKRLAAWKKAAAKAKAAGKKPRRRPRRPVDPKVDQNHPANLFNGMIAPLVPYGLRGAIWYQGERNARTVETAQRYAFQLPLLIEDWRTRWGQKEFPFFWVQLPNFKQRKDTPGAISAWAEIRESMRRSLTVPNTGMAITIDVGEAGDIHPKNKQAVGKRLALTALEKVYGKDVVGSGPLVQSHKVRGNEVVISFRSTGDKLVTSDGKPVRGFAIANETGQWLWAKARIEGKTVVVSHPDVKVPTAIRYAWADNPDVNLVNSAMLPASPFQIRLER